MRKRKLCSFLLALTMVVSLLAPSILSISVQAAVGNETDPSKGMVYHKTAEPNGEDTYKITLEAYATGAKFSSEGTKDVPTDIILVLDQSGSMKEDFLQKGETKFVEYTNKTNGNLYDKRHNGGSENLYHKLDENTYVTVSVEASFAGVDYEVIPEKVGDIWPHNRSCLEYLTYRYNMYVRIGGQYKKVETVYNLQNAISQPIFHYYVEGNLVATGDHLWSRPQFISGTTDDSKFYTAVYDESKTVYTYFYTDEDGTKRELGTSTGINGVFNTHPLYQKTTTSSTTTTRLIALKDAVTQFQNSVATKAMGKDGKVGGGDDINHRIAVVGFACSNTGNDSKYNNYQNTEIFIGEDGHKYGADANANAAQAFQDMSTDEGKNNVTASIGALEANGATYVNHGMELANTIWANDPLKDQTGRKRVVIVFTDGVPGYSGFENNVASSAISQADEIRKTYQADVYTVGIFDGADAESPGNQNGNDTQKANWFMQKMSNNLGKPQNPSYYLSANDSESLSSIFQKIADNIESGGSSTTLGKETVIKDQVSDYFQIPADTKPSNITVQTVPCTGITNEIPSWGEPETFTGANVTVDAATGAVSVSGFDFADNYVGMDKLKGEESLHKPAKKLVISFDVKANPEFLGGNDVPTNDGAYIYENASATKPVMTFNEPDVDVTIKTPVVGAPDKNVYLMDGLTADQIKEGVTVTVPTGEGKAPISIDLSNDAENYGLEEWQNQFVNIGVTYKDAEGNTLTDLTALKEDTSYTVEVVISPKTSKQDGVKAETGSGNGNINVFKPTLTYKDSEVYYGAGAPESYDDNKDGETIWKHGETVSTGTTMIGEEPPLTFTYTPDTDKVVGNKISTKQDIPVDVTVKIGGTDVTDKTTFVHTNCDNETWIVPNDKEFLLHVKTCQLTITKTGGASGEPYVFDVYKDGEKHSEVTIVGNTSKTIVELPIGTYTIKEHKDWSWRYTGQYSPKSVKLDVDNKEGTITCTNTNENDKWLNGFSEVVTNIFGESK